MCLKYLYYPLIFLNLLIQQLCEISAKFDPVMIKQQTKYSAAHLNKSCIVLSILWIIKFQIWLHDLISS